MPVFVRMAVGWKFLFISKGLEADLPAGWQSSGG
jgi:hypothetical protein